LGTIPFNFFNNFSRVESGIFAADWRQFSQYNYRHFEEKNEGFIYEGIGWLAAEIFAINTINSFYSL
jgi:hypothetical protein